MTSYDRGDIVLLPFPFTDLTTTKQRPAVVLSPRMFNESHNDVIVAAITSQVGPSRSADDVTLTDDDLKRGGLLKPSVVKPAKLVTIDQRLIRKRIGRLTDTSLRELHDRLQRLLIG